MICSIFTCFYAAKESATTEKTPRKKMEFKKIEISYRAKTANH